MNIYSVINMDIVNSRKIENRIEFQHELKKYFKELDDKYKNILIAPITFTLGDEWQIVLKVVEESYNLFIEINRFLHARKVKCYCGIGVGTISTAESMDTREMDGSAFIYAREAINSAKTNNRFHSKEIHTKDCRVVLKGTHIDIPELTSSFNTSINEVGLEEVAVTTTSEFSMLDVINTLIQNNEIIESKFTEKQREIISLYERLGSYKEIENTHPKFSKSSISHKLTASNYFLTIHNVKIIRELLRTYSLTLREQSYGV